MSDAEFGDLMHGSMDVEEPTGWVRLQTVLVVPEQGAVRCLDISATDEAGVVLELSFADREEYARRFIDAFYRRGKRAVHQGG